MVAQNWTEVVVASLQRLWDGVFSVLPSLIGALVIIIVGLVVAYVLGTLVVEKILEALKLDSLLAKLGLAPYFERGGLRLRGARFVGQLVYWFVTVAFLLAASDILGLFAFSSFLMQVLLYIPNVVMAVLIMLSAVVAANFVRKLASASVMSAKLHAANFLGSMAWWAIVVFGFLTALVELNVATSIINTVITGFVAMLALAGGLAFGLGGKDYASALINRLRETTGSK
ncbi:MAG: hypothetical protein HY506_00970 [Candidatus Yanofskybacteria bacterium]|nr:hypothetical protein [Candidatus Yanofskybacteria bacterium]